MSIWLEIARIAAGINVVLLVLLGSIWVRNYRRHGASHTLGLIVFASLLFVQNVLWLYFYLIHPRFIGWFLNATIDVQLGVTMLCGLELAALAILAKITWL